MNIGQEYSSKKILFIQSLLKLLPFNNWDNELIYEAEKDCKFAKGYSFLLFPNGIKEIIDFYEKWQDQNMLEYLAKVEVPIKIRDRVSLALKTRIKNCTTPIICSKAAAYFVLPNNITFGIKLAFRTCDVIWRYAGDKSLDYNYYSKRILLLGIYQAAVLYYVQDESSDYTDTNLFIDESVSDIINGFTYLKNLSRLIEPANIPIIRLFL